MALVIRGIVYHAENQTIGTVGQIGFVGGLYGEKVKEMPVGLAKAGAVDASKAVEYHLWRRVAKIVKTDKSIVGMKSTPGSKQ